MNETRKELINILSDYMDKSLSEGCIIKNKNNRIFKFNGKESKRQFAGCDDFYKTKGVSDGGLDIYLSNIELEEYKILGHYDITAVFKYIDSLHTDNYFIEKEKLEDTIRIYTEDLYENGKITKWGDNLGWLLCKPLHLYTEQEEKDLLELLLKL